MSRQRVYVRKNFDLTNPQEILDSRRGSFGRTVDVSGFDSLTVELVLTAGSDSGTPALDIKASAAMGLLPENMPTNLGTLDKNTLELRGLALNGDQRIGFELTTAFSSGTLGTLVIVAYADDGAASNGLPILETVDL